jgi:hypothetical protein
LALARSPIFSASTLANDDSTASKTFRTSSFSVARRASVLQWKPAHDLAGKAVERSEQHEVELASAGVLEEFIEPLGLVDAFAVRDRGNSATIL